MVRCLCGLLLVIGVAFSDCPSGCCCPRPGALVLCESLGLRSLPRSVPLNTAVLSVARNRLCDVDHLLMPFSGLQELSLSHNQLAHFPKGLPPSLEALQLQENRITYLTAGGLRRLGNLTRLDLEDNRIRVVQPGAFRGLGKLQVLSLRGNRLQGLPQSLPPSLTHLDLSANCIAALDPSSMAGLVNLQVLKINSNCLRSVPERAFDGMLRLGTVELADNLWACECDLLYLYRWLLDGRLRLATRLVCSAPVHLARRPLLTLPVTAICPRVLRPNSTVALDDDGASVAAPNVEARALLTAMRASPAMPGEFGPSSSVSAEVNPERSVPAEDSAQTPGVLHARLLQPHYTLEELSYEDCLSLNSTLAPAAPTQGPHEDASCTDTPRSPYPPRSSSTTTEISSPVLPTNKAAILPATPPPGPGRLWDPSPITALLALLCVLVVLLMVAVLLVLKKVLHRNQRVAPAQVS